MLMDGWMDGSMLENVDDGWMEPSIHLLYVCVYACLPECGFLSGRKGGRGSFFRSQTFLFLTWDVGLRSLLHSRTPATRLRPEGRISGVVRFISFENKNDRKFEN